ncbi:hypothetical protein AMELA_G00215290 [Ameiurus melas]|uniref:Uncharacterized protein n=1 Tax=Ameiurus melas TaxID=219545 RepID=A0A7J6A2P8_AMEME|nr:hypothetical protein AMELA_G00215290 [Ameiurus melas]
MGEEFAPPVSSSTSLFEICASNGGRAPEICAHSLSPSPSLSSAPVIGPPSERFHAVGKRVRERVRPGHLFEVSYLYRGEEKRPGGAQPEAPAHLRFNGLPAFNGGASAAFRQTASWKLRYLC